MPWRLVKVIGSAVASLLIGIRITLDVIGYSTSPEDFESLGPKVRAMLDYIASQPGLLVYGLPLVLLFAIVWSILDQRANQRLTPRAQSQNGSVKDQRMLLKAQTNLVKAQTERDDVHKKATTSRRDIGVGDAIAYMAFGMWGHTFEEAASSHDIDVAWAQRQFHQAAADGDVAVWGRPSDARLYTPIGKEYWLENKIEWFSLLKSSPHTEPANPRDLSQQRYIDLMTSRSDAEWLFNTQSPEVLRSKSVARRLTSFFDEGVAERNKLLPIIEDFDAQRQEETLLAWNEKVVSKFDAAGVSEGDHSRFKTLNTFEPELQGVSGRNAEQERLEMIWNKKLQILRTIIDEIGQ